MVDPGHPCPLCGHDFASTVFAAHDRYTGTGVFPVLRCKACNVLFTGGASPSPSSMYPDTYDPYDAMAVSRGSRISELVARHSPRIRPLLIAAQSGPLLDVGCGGGLGMRQLTARGATVFGVDISLGSLRRAPRGAASVAEFLALPFGAGTFSGINLHHVLEHTDHPVSLLTELSRVLRADGVLRIAVPIVAAFYPARADAFHAGWDVPRHRVHFTPATFERTLACAGLAASSLRYFPEPGVRLLSRPSRAHHVSRRLAERASATASEWLQLFRYRQSVVLEAVVRKS